MQIDPVPNENLYIGILPEAEQEDWFTGGVPTFGPPSFQAQPKQPWDSYKPEFWLGFIAYKQEPLSNLPYFWGSWDDRDFAANYSYFTPLQQQATGVAQALLAGGIGGAPTTGIYTGETGPYQATGDPCTGS